jgi:hypothetical protein
MQKNKPLKDKNIILVCGKASQKSIDAVRDLSEYLGRKYRYALITSNKQVIERGLEPQIDILIRTQVTSEEKVEEALLDIQDQVAAIVNYFDSTVEIYKKVVPHFPYLKIPTVQSITRANDKLKMRKALNKYAPTTIPRFMLVDDASKETLDAVDKIIKFPCMVKPTRLAKSMLVRNVYYREELEEVLKDTFKKVKKKGKDYNLGVEPQVMVEALIEGTMYSVDVYVNSRGKLYFTPYIEIKTGKDIGHDDFYMYTQMTPSNLEPDDIEKANRVVEDGVHALGLRSITAHVELYRTKKNGFKIVEVGPRLGGYRQELLGDAYSMNHYLNDILIRMGKTPIMKIKPSQHTVFMKFWPPKGGTLKSLTGFKKISEQDFVIRSKQFKKVGDRVGLSKFGNPCICNFHLKGVTRSELLGNIRKVEKAIKIELE